MLSHMVFIELPRSVPYIVFQIAAKGNNALSSGYGALLGKVGCSGEESCAKVMFLFHRLLWIFKNSVQ